MPLVSARECGRVGAESQVDEVADLLLVLAPPRGFASYSMREMHLLRRADPDALQVLHVLSLREITHLAPHAVRVVPDQRLGEVRGEDAAG